MNTETTTIEVLQVKERKTGKIYDCIPQIVSLDISFNIYSKKFVLRYNIGLNGYNDWINKECIYNNEEFNKKYIVLNDQ